MALFGLNWDESKWPGHFCPEVPTFFASKIGVKLPPEKKVPWHWRCAALCWGSNCHFCQKNAFFGQKMTFFQKDCFIEKLSVTQNTIFECLKNNFLLSNPDLVFFTEFNLIISILMPELLPSNMFCTDGNVNSVIGTCYGDSGGPHIRKYVWNDLITFDLIEINFLLLECLMKRTGQKSTYWWA